MSQPSGSDGSAVSPTPENVTERLVGEVYGELRVLARHYLRNEPAGHPLQATALVHEAYLRLSRLREIDWQGRTHFLAIAATQMRRVLVDQARATRAAKRGDGAVRVTFHEGLAGRPAPLDLLDLHSALARLGRRHGRQERVAELRLFSGLGFTEIAEAVDASERTVRQDWVVARAWLARQLRGGASGAAPAR